MVPREIEESQTIVSSDSYGQFSGSFVFDVIKLQIQFLQAKESKFRQTKKYREFTFNMSAIGFIPSSLIWFLMVEQKQYVKYPARLREVSAVLFAKPFIKALDPAFPS